MQPTGLSAESRQLTACSELELVTSRATVEPRAAWLIAERCPLNACSEVELVTSRS